MFEGTVRDNLTMWDATVPDMPRHSGLQGRPLSADGRRITSRRSSKLRSAEGGTNFSGGQRQRLENRPARW